MKKMLCLAACVFGLLVPGSRLQAQTPTPTGVGTPPKDSQARASATDLANIAADLGIAAAQEPEETKKRSPWLLLPLVSTNPKMATSGGLLGAYLHYFDPQSQVSMFGLWMEYSTSDSTVGGVFGRSSFGRDHHRLEGVAGFGRVHNVYEDYLGTGEPFETTDNIHAVAARYLYRVKGNWFIGAQTLFANYDVTGTSANADKILEDLGLSGVKTGGIGLAVMHDSRDNQDMPTSGWYATVNNVADRDWLGADANYGTYRVDIKWFRQHGKGHVFALRQNNDLTANAPANAETTINMRGYKMEQYLGKYMSSLEGEERIRFSRRWGATIFGGVGALYGGSKNAVNSNGWYPSYGAGVHFVLKPEDHMLMNVEYAHADLNNYGIYLTLGYAW